MVDGCISGWDKYGLNPRLKIFLSLKASLKTVRQTISNAGKTLQHWHIINLIMECRQSGTFKAPVTARQYNVRHGKFIV